jgi:hypothetical protein
MPDDCRRCGVCCFSSLPTYVPVTGADWSRLGDAAERLAHFIGHRAFMRMGADRCAALVVAPTAGSAVEFSCSVYEQRPQACRDLARGSPQCAGEITTKAMRVAAAVDCPPSTAL